MTTQAIPGKLVAVRDPERGAEEAARLCAASLQKAIATRGTASLAVSGGATPLPAYRRLAGLDVPWDRVKLFWVDERAVPPTDGRSNARAVLEAFGPLPFLGVFPMDGADGDLAAAARAYADIVAQEVPGAPPQLDVVVLGIGADGHTASLFPGDPATLDTTSTVLSVSAAPAREARITLGRRLLGAARSTYVIAFGSGKTAALERAWAVTGDVASCPARITRGFAGTLTWVVDRAAAGLT